MYFEIYFNKNKRLLLNTKIGSFILYLRKSNHVKKLRSNGIY